MRTPAPGERGGATALAPPLAAGESLSPSRDLSVVSFPVCKTRGFRLRLRARRYPAREASPWFLEGGTQRAPVLLWVPGVEQSPGLGDFQPAPHTQVRRPR